MRNSGILMPIFSLPTETAIGNIGTAAYKFVDFLNKAGQKYWQLLPLCPVDYTYSPYQSVSCFAGETSFIDFELLADEGLILPEELDGAYKPSDFTRVDYLAAKEYSHDLLLKAFSRFSPNDEYKTFLEKNEFWVGDYALYMALKCDLGVAWYDFPKPLKYREKAALCEAKERLSHQIDFYLFSQFVFFKQWQALKDYADKRNVKLIGDMPIYVPLDSADVWVNREFFELDQNGRPTLIAGTPPDAFSKTGQLWGCPVYSFEKMGNDTVPFSWWRNRIKAAADMYHTVRIDHFRAFESFFAVPAGDATAQNGSYIKGPGKEFFDLVKKDLGTLPIIAEDLGYITKEVRELLSYTGLPGMRVLQFAFDGDRDNLYLPYNFTKNTVAYIGTHDNDTFISWYNTLPDAPKKQLCDYLGNSGEAVNWAAIRLLMSSVADTVIFTMQDIMGLGNSARINTPGTQSGNWVWRMADGCANDWLAEILRVLTNLYGR